MDILNKTNIQNKILRAPEFGDEGGGGTSSSSSNAINIGGVEVDKFYLGNSDDVKIYLGDTLLYPQTVSYKLISQYSDTSEYKVECDGSTTLSTADTRGHTTQLSAMTNAVVNGDCVTTIGMNAFSGANSVTSITLTDGVTTFQNQAFIEMHSIQDFTFPSTLTTIGGSIFRFNTIRKFNNKIPSGVTYLGSGAFADMYSLSSMTIPATITGSSDNLFLRDSGLTEVHFEGTTPPALGANAFKGCTALSKIYIPSCDNYDAYAANAQFSAYTDLIYAEDATKCKGESYPFVFKREHNGGSAYTRACDSTSATTLTSGMTRSGTTMSVISGTSKQVTAITVGDCTKKIDAGAFSGWTKVTSIIISDSVQEIGKRAFYSAASASNGTAILGRGIRKIGDYAFYKNKAIRDVTLYSGTTLLDTYSFAYCDNLSGLTFQNGFDFPEDSASAQYNFGWCKSLKQLSFPSSVKSIPKYAFKNCSGITSVTFSENGIQTIKDAAFQDCSGLTSVVLPNSLVTLQQLTFQNCGNLERIDIGSGCTGIGSSCIPNVKVVISRNPTPPSLINTTQGAAAPFSKWTENNITYPDIYVPDNAVDTYKNANFWTNHSPRIHPLSDLN